MQCCCQQKGCFFVRKLVEQSGNSEVQSENLAMQLAEQSSECSVQHTSSLWQCLQAQNKG